MVLPLQDSDFEFVAFDTTSFFLTVSNLNCNDSDTAMVFTIVTNEEALIPNAFTPNSDTWNQTFGVINYDKFQSIEMTIYNRWGEIVFTEKSSNPQWDGTYEGNKMNLDTYYYFITTVNANMEESIHGA